jgi:hypothetical protein
LNLTLRSPIIAQERNNEEQISGGTSRLNRQKTGKGESLGCRIPSPVEKHFGLEKEAP